MFHGDFLLSLSHCITVLLIKYIYYISRDTAYTYEYLWVFFFFFWDMIQTPKPNPILNMTQDPEYIATIDLMLFVNKYFDRCTQLQSFHRYLDWSSHMKNVKIFWQNFTVYCNADLE